MLRNFGQLPIYLLGILACFAIFLSAAEIEFSPSAEYSAEEAVQIQLAALKNNDYPKEDAGIAVAYRFASPSNKSITGPLEHFTAMVSGGPYRYLLNHTSVRIGEPDQDESNARVPIIVTSTDGQEIGYVFVMSKQDDKDCKCWMTDSVVPIQSRETQSTPII